jgi:hypothetical protein
MEESNASAGLAQPGSNHLVRYAVLAAILLTLVVASLGYRAWTTRPANTSEAPLERISANELEERYGLGVRLIGVTAGGGMIDFRLKILEPEKARQFLQDPANSPISMVTEDGTELLAADGMEDEVTWEEGGILFILLPNSGGAIQPGAPVTVEFGDVQLEPIPAQ